MRTKNIQIKQQSVPPKTVRWSVSWCTHQPDRFTTDSHDPCVGSLEQQSTDTDCKRKQCPCWICAPHGIAVCCSVLAPEDFNRTRPTKQRIRNRTGRELCEQQRLRERAVWWVWSKVPGSDI